MGIVMDMSSYGIERGDAPEAEYGEEVLCAGWNPALNLACRHSIAEELPMPAGLVEADMEAFLQKMYALQR